MPALSRQRCAAGAGAVNAVVMGVITAAAGGIIRDILGHEPSIILRREIYVTASLIGAVAYVLLFGLGQERAVAAAVGAMSTFVVRGLAKEVEEDLNKFLAARPGIEIVQMGQSERKDHK